MKGIDISQGSQADFNALKAAGYSFVIARAGWGSSSEQKDSDFHNNVMKAIAAGLHVGAYWFLYYRSIVEAQQNAEAFNAVLQPYLGMLDMPVYIDYEEDTTRYFNQYSNIKEDKLIANAALGIACRQMEIFGWYSGYYCNVNYLVNHFDAGELEMFTRWLACWSNSKPKSSCDIWQSAGDVKIPEARGKVDLDECYIDFPSIIIRSGLNGYKKPDKKKSIFENPIQLANDGTWRFI